MVRELYGVARSRKANALFVSTCKLTKSAKAFARENNIGIWDRENIISKTTLSKS